MTGKRVDRLPSAWRCAGAGGNLNQGAFTVAVAGLLVAALASSIAGCSGGMEAADMAGSQSAPAFEAGENAVNQTAGRSSTVLAAGESAAAGLAADTGRKLIFSADLSLVVEDPAAVIQDARQWVEARGGFVEQSEIQLGGYASLVLRVPQQAYEDTLAHLRALAVEVQRDESGRVDVTQQFADLDARLTNLKAAEVELRALMTEARELGGTAEDVMTVYRQITETRGQIDSLQAQFNVLSEQIALSTIQVQLKAVPEAPRSVAERWRPDLVLQRARSDLVSAMKDIADAAIYFAVAIAPVLVILLIALWIAVWILRLIVRLFRRGGKPKPDIAAPPADVGRADASEQEPD